MFLNNFDNVRIELIFDESVVIIGTDEELDSIVYINKHSEIYYLDEEGNAQEYDKDRMTMLEFTCADTFAKDILNRFSFFDELLK